MMMIVYAWYLTCDNDICNVFTETRDTAHGGWLRLWRNIFRYKETDTVQAFLEKYLQVLKNFYLLKIRIKRDFSALNHSHFSWLSFKFENWWLPTHLQGFTNSLQLVNKLNILINLHFFNFFSFFTPMNRTRLMASLPDSQCLAWETTQLILTPVDC